MKWRQDQTHVVKEIYEDFGCMIERQQTKMEEEVEKIKKVYTSHIQMLETKRQDRIYVFKKAEEEVQKLVKSLADTKKDI